MSNIKYNVGDRVRIREWADMERQFGLNMNGNINCKFVFVDDMRDLCGKVFVIERIAGDHFYLTPSAGWQISADMIEPLQQKKIVITADGCETLARLYDGNKVVKTATAKCSPDDTFDFNTGVKIAMGRLMGEDKPDTTQTEFVVGDYYKYANDNVFDDGIIKIVKKDGERFSYEIIAGLKKDIGNHQFVAGSCFAQHLTPYTGWKVVDRKPKVGDYIQLVEHSPMFTFDRVGDVLQIDGIDYSPYVFGKNHKRDTGDNGNYKWHYHRNEYEIVEPVLETEKPKKSKPTFQMGDRVSHAEWGNGTVICMAHDGDYGVEFDEGTGCCHDCEGIGLAQGKRGTKGTSHWCLPTDLTLLPKKWNGKVVCVESEISFWTVCKVYEIKDGIIVDDDGDERKPIESPDDLPMVTSYDVKFVPVSDDPSIGETPKGYTGKVVAVKRGYGHSASLGVVTLGKVYTVKDGIGTMDGKYPSCWYKTLDDFCRGMGWTFLPVAE